MTITPSKQKTGQQVGTLHVDQLIRGYKKERWVYNSRRLGKADSLSTWYGLNELTAFLELARENKADGIKICYGVYPTGLPGSPELAGRQTVVLVATKQTITGAGTLNKNIYTRKNGAPEILAFNFGSICPPYCGSGNPPDGDGFFGIDMEKSGISIVNYDNQLIVI